MNYNNYGWSLAAVEIANKYIEKCKILASSDELFSNFRQDCDYKKVLEGGERIVGDIHSKRIMELYGINLIKDKLNEFKENDIYGNPTIMNFEFFGNICPCTILYISHALDIVKMMGDFKPNKIVEIGGGFGALCKTLSVFYDFDEYVIIDLPEVIPLCRKYLNNFPKIKDKITYITCEEFRKGYIKIDDADLFIAIASLAECDTETQKSYIDILLKSKYGFIIYNTLHCNGGNSSFEALKEMMRDMFKITQTFHENIPILEFMRKI